MKNRKEKWLALLFLGVFALGVAGCNVEYVDAVSVVGTVDAFELAMGESSPFSVMVAFSDGTFLDATNDPLLIFTPAHPHQSHAVDGVAYRDWWGATYIDLEYGGTGGAMHIPDVPMDLQSPYNTGTGLSGDPVNISGLGVVSKLIGGGATQYFQITLPPTAGNWQVGVRENITGDPNAADLDIYQYSSMSNLTAIASAITTGVMDTLTVDAPSGGLVTIGVYNPGGGAVPYAIGSWDQKF